MKAKQQGFTLVEVMVAVGVIAIALPAILLTMMNQIDGTAHLRDKMQAQWVADNKLTELRVRNTIDGAIPEKTFSGDEDMAGRKWHWQTTSESYGGLFPDVFQIRISVWLDDENFDADDSGDPLITMETYLLKGGKTPITRPTPPSPP